MRGEGTVTNVNAQAKTTCLCVSNIPTKSSNNVRWLTQEYVVFQNSITICVRLGILFQQSTLLFILSLAVRQCWAISEFSSSRPTVYGLSSSVWRLFNPDALNAYGSPHAILALLRW